MIAPWMIRRNYDRLFRVGDRVIYPNHGVGCITELKTLSYGDFYSIQMDTGNVKILVPIAKMSKVGAIYLDSKKLES